MCQPEGSNHGRLRRIRRSDLLVIEYIGTGLTGQARGDQDVECQAFSRNEKQEAV